MRYAIIGTGARSAMFYNALSYIKEIKDEHELVALLDLNPKRMEYVKKKTGKNLATYLPHQFEEMIEKEKIGGIIVTTKDSTHDEYIIKGLKRGLRVITEKPLTTDEKKCQAILETIEETGNDQLIVTFNYRYSPYRSRVKELIQAGTIGRVTMVEFQWYLDTTHGADYYRRWHRNKENSGSLLVHKSTHHFDLVNWWIDSYPEQVVAMGRKNFYRPETFPYRLRCRTCDLAEECKFRLDLSESQELTGLYLEAEGEDGYFRDACVFSPEIDIWDTRTVMASYNNGVLLSYSLNNYAPYEGYRVSFVGTRGRIEQDVIEASYISGHDGKIERRTEKHQVRLEVFPLFNESYTVDVEVGEGEHGGGDLLLLKDIFLDRKEADPLRRKAGALDGALSILTGIASRRSIEEGRIINVKELMDFSLDRLVQNKK